MRRLLRKYFDNYERYPSPEAPGNTISNSAMCKILAMKISFSDCALLVLNWKSQTWTMVTCARELHA